MKGISATCLVKRWCHSSQTLHRQFQLRRGSSSPWPCRGGPGQVAGAAKGARYPSHLEGICESKDQFLAVPDHPLHTAWGTNRASPRSNRILGTKVVNPREQAEILNICWFDVIWWRSLVIRASREYSKHPQEQRGSLAGGLTGTRAQATPTFWVTLNIVLKAPYPREETKRKCKICAVELASPFQWHLCANSF